MHISLLPRDLCDPLTFRDTLKQDFSPSSACPFVVIGEDFHALDGHRRCTWDNAGLGAAAVKVNGDAKADGVYGGFHDGDE